MIVEEVDNLGVGSEFGIVGENMGSVVANAERLVED